MAGLIVLSLLFKSVYTQNLIQNPSFEFYTNIDCASGTYSVINNWNGLGSPDYYHSLCSVNNYNMPKNRFGTAQELNNNHAYVGIVTFYKSSEYKEYIQQSLSSTLISGTTYYLSFYVSRSDRTIYSTNNTGAYFSVIQPTVVGNTFYSATPQVQNQTGFITDTIGWTKIEGYFKAQGGEQYITIGNFNSNLNTDTVNSGTENPIPFDPGEAYYYIDSVSLYDSLDYVTNIRKIEDKIQLAVYPNPTTEVIKLDVDSKNKRDLLIRITDVMGREVKSIDYEEEIDVSDLDRGVYFLSLYQKGILLGTKKILKE